MSTSTCKNAVGSTGFICDKLPPIRVDAALDVITSSKHTALQVNFQSNQLRQRWNHVLGKIQWESMRGYRYVTDSCYRFSEEGVTRLQAKNQQQQHR